MSGEPSSDDVYVFPASSAQERLWFLDQLEPDTCVYSIPQALRLRGGLDAELVRRSLVEIVARHESLRTTFAAPDGIPVQVVTDEVSLPFTVQSVADLPTERERVEEARRLVQVEAERPFDLSRGPLLRAGLVALGPEDHVLWLDVHHIVCDGWSLGLLYEELSALYRAFERGAGSPLPEVPIQYPDFVIWQRESLGGDALAAELAHWKRALGPTVPVLELPTDRPRPAAPTTRGAQLTFDLPAELAGALGSLAKTESASLFQVLLAAYYVLLYRLSGQTDVVVGAPVANRERAEVEKAIGFYTNTVVFRGDLAGEPTFREVLRRTRAVVLSGLAHQDLPFDRVVEAVQTDRSAGFHPLFQAMFALQRAPESALDLPGVRAEPWTVHPRTSKFDVLCELQETSRGLAGLFEYNTDLFDDATAERFVSAFRVLLGSIAAAPDAVVEDLDVLSLEERAAQIDGWNRTDAELPARAAHEIVTERAVATPDAVAIEAAGAVVRYGELERRSNQLARALAARGVGPGDHVGIALERSAEIVVAMLAVGKLGAAYLPIDPAYPAERVGFMLSDAGARLVITRSADARDLPAESPPRLLLDEEAGGLEACSGEPFERRSDPSSAAYLLYTSGSTGRPKGVVIPHLALANFLSSMQREPGCAETDRLLAVTTVSFDISGLELLLPLVSGGAVVLASRDEATSGEDLVRLVAERRITLLQATPATFRLMIEAGWERSPDLRVLCGGEALPPDLAEALLERAGEVWNMYGPTETTIWSTCCRVTDPSDVTIGRPIANTRVYVLDAKLRPVVVGVPGDLYLGGAGVAAGYWGRPDLTAERFVPDPFRPAARMYKTGDRVRARPDGALTFLGRADHQVKVRGYRIELGEIEAVLSRVPSVEACVVVVRRDGAGDPRIVAYAVHRPGMEPTASELRQALKVDLPEYMVPHHFVSLAALPLTDNKKIDRNGLPDPFAGSARPPAEYSAPRSDTERLVSEVWREVLGLERVSLDENFFEIGGHSLLSMQVVARLQRRTGHRLNPRSMAFSTLEQIAAEIDAARAAAAPAAPKGASAEGDAPRPSEAPPPGSVEGGSLSRRLLGAIKSRVFR